MQLAYDEENRLTYATDSKDFFAAYDALGRRVYVYDDQTGVETRTVFSGLAAIEEYTIDATPDREFVWGTSFTEPVAMIDYTLAGQEGANTPEVLHYLHGALGSVVALTEAGGNVVERYVYDPYGRTRIYDAGGTLQATDC